MIASVLLILASIYDKRTGKIPNVLILWGYLIGIFFQVLINGPPGVVHFLIKAGMPIIGLYLLFFINALGAGDVKLISVTSVYLDGRFTISLILTSFFIGAGISCLRILKNKDFFDRMHCFTAYIGKSLKTKRILKYSTLNKGSSYIHFSVCILFAYIYLLLRRGFV